MILITGASSGIGEACAEAFARRKADLILIGRRKERLATLSSRLTDDYGVKVHFFPIDISDRAAIEKFVSEHPALLSQVKVLVNNAGLAKGLDPFQEASIDDWEVMIDTNLKGLLYMTRSVLPFMVREQRGHIVNIGSVAGRWNYPKGNVYAATKWAVRSLTESMRLDLCGTPIRVTEISPGMVETEFSEVRLGNTAEAKRVYEGMTPLKAEDVAEAVTWCCERPAHVNVQEIVLYPTDQASPTVVNRVK